VSRDNEENSLRRANRVNLITVPVGITICAEVYESGRKGGKARARACNAGLPRERISAEPGAESREPRVLKLHVCICICTGLSKSSKRMPADKRIKRPEGGGIV
jgi:hypothetical protein